LARVCQITGKKPLSGQNVSHANNKTKRKQLPNLQNKRIWLEDQKKWVRVKATARGLRTLDKVGNGVLIGK
jgi:large subunit ribosomal protein L28